jgi:8-oxo-dGTP diphosphatase
MIIDKREQILNGPKHFLRNVSVCNVIFGYHEKQLSVLLLRPLTIDKWIIPGGYIRHIETIEEAATRVIEDMTNLKNLYLKQFKSFGTPERRSDDSLTPWLLGWVSAQELDTTNWMFDYFVTIGYYTLVEFSKVAPDTEDFREECKWWDINNIPEMMFDYRNIIFEALHSLRKDIHHYPIGIELLPKKFTLPDIHCLYETILGRNLDYRNFSKKLIATDIIKRLDEKRNIGAHRSPYLYVFNEENYRKELIEGFVMTF